jgi:hypothetical protein
MARSRRRPRRIFIGLTEIAGYYGQLAEGFRSHGIGVTFVDLSENPFRYGGSSSDPIARMATMASTRRAKALRRGGPRAAVARIAFRLALAVLFASAVARHDTFIFGFGSSFFWLRELRLLRLLGKTIVFVFNGSDARPPFIDGALMDPAHGRSIEWCVDVTQRRKRDIREIERNAHLVISHALYLHLFERPAAGFQVIGLPGPPGTGPEAPEPEPASDTIRILHSPSQRGAKGTSRIRSAVERLRADGMNLELIELHGVPNEVVHRELRRCHFVIDQLYSDGPMLSFTREAAQYSRPAIVGSYGWEEIRRLMPAGSIAPVEGCHPDELESAIRRLASDPAHRRQLGRAACEFLAGWTPALVARRYLRLLRGERPAAWMCDPSAVRYMHGVGLAEERAREIVAAVIDRAGVPALRVRDKPELERAFIAFGQRDQSA